jgi:hypothetical protein
MVLHENNTAKVKKCLVYGKSLGSRGHFCGQMQSFATVLASKGQLD